VIDKDLHDANGPVKRSFPHNKRYAANVWVKAFDSLGLKMMTDPQTGRENGGYR
jgi:hypothetical protein